MRSFLKISFNLNVKFPPTTSNGVVSGKQGALNECSQYCLEEHWWESKVIISELVEQVRFRAFSNKWITEGCCCVWIDCGNDYRSSIEVVCFGGNKTFRLLFQLFATWFYFLFVAKQTSGKMWLWKTCIFLSMVFYKHEVYLSSVAFTQFMEHLFLSL